MSPSTRAVLGMVVLAACVRSVSSTTADAGFDAGFDVAIEAEFDIGTEVAVAVDRPIGDLDAGAPQDATIRDESAVRDVGAPYDDVVSGGACRGYEPSTFCTGPCGSCVNAESAGACRAESDALRLDPVCAMMDYGFQLCFASCVLGRDAGFGNCIDYVGPLVSNCNCYDRCVAARPAECQPRRRAYDRCIAARCAACRF